MNGHTLIAWLARLYPWEVTTSDDLARALDFLDSDLYPDTVVRAGYGGALLLAPLGVVAVRLVPAPFAVPVGLLAVALVLGTVHAIHRIPVLLATARRTRAVGAAPDIVSRLVLRMRVSPSPEQAAAFAARTGEGPLVASLRDHVRDAAGTPRSGLETFGREWQAQFPALRRALLLVESAATARHEDRERTLERALEAVLDGTRDRMAEFAEGLQGPTTAVYAFGVLLPLALIALLPVAGMTGLSLGVAVIVLVYDVLLPVAIAVAGVWLLARRPAAFPPPNVDWSHPDVPDRQWLSSVAGLLAGLGAGVGAWWFLAAWLAPLFALGVGFGVGLVVRYRPFLGVRRNVRAVESGLTDALYHVGRRVEEGAAVEAALRSGGEEVTAATGAVLAEAARRQRNLSVGLETALLGERGALGDVPSPRARSMAALLVLAAREGRPAGRAIVATADHLEALGSVEREARRQVGRVTRTLRNTATVFGPLVAGATVALADRMAAGETFTTGTAPETAELGLAVGVYVLLFAALLTTLATGLSRGLDRSLAGYRVGRALLVATAVYTLAFLAAGAVV